MCVRICTSSHHASQFGVELPSKRLDQVHIVTARCFKQHLKGLEPVVSYTVHWERQKGFYTARCFISTCCTFLFKCVLLFN